jgi:hypothetical protein
MSNASPPTNNEINTAVRNANSAFKALVTAMSSENGAPANKLNAATTAIRKLQNLKKRNTAGVAAALGKPVNATVKPSMFAGIKSMAQSVGAAVSGLVSRKSAVTPADVGSVANKVRAAIDFVKAIKFKKGRDATAQVNGPLRNKIRTAFARAPANYNKIIAAYNSGANNNAGRFNAASRMATEYRNAPKFKKNLTGAAFKLTAFRRGGPAGQYASRQKFLNEMAAFYKKQVNNRTAFEKAEAEAKRAEAEAKRLANAAARVINVHRTIARELYNRSKKNNTTGKRKNAAMIWTSVPSNVRNKMQNYKEVERILNTYATNINNAAKLAQVRQQINYAKKVLRNRATGETGQAEFASAFNGVSTLPPLPPSGRLISRGNFMIGTDEVEVLRHAKGPANVFYTRLPMGNYRKLKKNAKNPSKFNFNNLNTRFYTNTNTGFEPTNLQKAANDYVKSLYNKTGRVPWGPQNSKNIIRNNPVNNRLVQRKNITAAALQRFLTGPNKPTQGNANKRITHLKDIIAAAHGVKTNAATQNIGDKKNTLETLIDKNVKTMNYTTAGQHYTNVQDAYTAYTSAVNQGIGKLPNADRKLIADRRAKFNAEVQQVQSSASARRAQLMANTISANLSGKTGANLTSAITKARVNIDTLPNGTNKTRAQAALNTALKAAAKEEIAKILSELNTQIPAATATNVNANKYAALATALAKAIKNINDAAGNTGANKPNLASYETRLRTFGNKINRATRLKALQNKISNLTITATNNTSLDVMVNEIDRVEDELEAIKTLTRSGQFTNTDLGNAQVAPKADALAVLKAAAKTKADRERVKIIGILDAVLAEKERVINNKKQTKTAVEAALGAVRSALANAQSKKDLKNIKDAGIEVKFTPYITRVSNMEAKAANFNKFRIIGRRGPAINYVAAAQEYVNAHKNAGGKAQEQINRKHATGMFGGMFGYKNKNMTAFWKAVNGIRKLKTTGVAAAPPLSGGLTRGAATLATVVSATAP